MDPLWRKSQARKRKPGRKHVRKAKRFASTGQRGQALYRKACSVCHSIGHGDRVGPDLKGVVGRRDSDWLTRFIMTPGDLRRQKDPLALALSKRFPGRSMPYLGLSETDVADVLSFIEASSGNQRKETGSREATPRASVRRSSASRGG